MRNTSNTAKLRVRLGFWPNQSERTEPCSGTCDSNRQVCTRADPPSNERQISKAKRCEVLGKTTPYGGQKRKYKNNGKKIDSAKKMKQKYYFSHFIHFIWYVIKKKRKNNIFNTIMPRITYYKKEIGCNDFVIVYLLKLWVVIY